MKKFYSIMLFLSSFTFINKVDAQVTLIDDNHSLSGLAIGNNIILESDIDSTLWISDGTPLGTKQYAFNVKVDDNGSGGVLNSKIYFAGIGATLGSELWVSDGTAGGTTLVSDLNTGAGNSTPDNFFLFKGDLYFTASTPALGRELYKISGANGTVSLFKDVNPGAGSGFNSTNGIDFYSNNNLMYFTADDGVHGTELWVSDGTAMNTSMLADITVGANSTTFGQFSHLGNEVIFSISTATFSLDLWKTNGTSAGTSLLKSFNVPGSGYITGFLPFNNKLYFAGTDASTGTELWSTDGTTTEMISDINPGTSNSLPILYNAIIINNHFIFSATSDLNGNELWISDGIKGGSTTMLKDINPGTADASPIIYPAFNFTNIVNSGSSLDDIYNRTQLFNGFIFFSADDGTHGTELWKTDGTIGGTTMVKDINLGSVGGLQNTGDYYYTTTGLYFAADDGTTGIEPWVSDGTSANTKEVFNINPGAGDSDPTFYFIKNGTLYFTADNGNSANGYTDFYKINGTLTDLPVTILNFTATLQSKAVQLNWTTSSEINSGHFVIQRSPDGVHFTDIGREAASGNSSTEKKYGYNDEDAYQAGSDILFYRLQIVDLDGKSHYSNILSVKLKGGITELKVYPNPVRNQLGILFNTISAGSAYILITDINGKRVYHQTINGGNSSGLQNIDVSTFANGAYFIQLITKGGGSKTIKFVKE